LVTFASSLTERGTALHRSSRKFDQQLGAIFRSVVGRRFFTSDRQFPQPAQIPQHPVPNHRHQFRHAGLRVGNAS
jgi:hypothetical protein